MVAPSSLSISPTRLRLADLLHVTDRFADDVLGGHYDHVLPAGGPPRGERWFTRLHGDDELDVWLISWVPDRSTELHDHGGSLGALTVLSGSLRETRWDGHRLHTRWLDAGDQAAFPLGWVHDVEWARETATIGGTEGSGTPSAPTLVCTPIRHRWPQCRITKSPSETPCAASAPN